MADKNKSSKKENKDKNDKKVKLKSGVIQKFIPIKKLQNGIIVTSDDRYLKLIELEPVNFTLRSVDEQISIIANFAAWLKIAPIKMQFKSITKKADSDKHIDSVKADLRDESNEDCKALAKDYIKLIDRVGNRDALSRRFFIIFEYEPYRKADGYNFEDAQMALNAVETTARQYLAHCGNTVVKWQNPNNEIAEILYVYFNRYSSINEPFQSRVNRVIKDTMESKGLIPGKDPIPHIRLSNYIAPRGLDFSHSAYYIMDGLYYTVIALKSNGFRERVFGGWLSRFVNAGDGIDVDVIVDRADRSKILDKISHKIILNRVKIKDSNEANSDYEEMVGAVKAGYYIKECLSNNEDFYYMSVLITISAPTLSDLNWKKQQVINMLKASDYSVTQLRFQQEQAMKSVMPILQLDSDIYEKTKRNVTTYGLASTYMFTSYELSDDNGVLLGLNSYNRSLCIIDLFNTKRNKNANLVLLGTSGAGKTFTMQLLALRMRMRGIQSFIITPIKGHEYKAACNAIGGTFVKIAPGSPHCINVMEIRHTVTPDMELLEDVGIDDLSMLTKKIQQLMVFFSLLIPDLSNEEEQLLDETLVKTYEQFGITHDNDSLYEDKTCFPPKMKKMPILGDLYNNLLSNPRTERIAIIISRFVTGSAQSFNQQTNVDLNNKYVVLDLSDLSGKLLPVGMMIALDYVWDIAKADRTKKKAIFIDEIWKLIGVDSNKMAAEFCLTIFKTIRGYGGAAISATQDLSDFFSLEGGRYGRGIINNSKNKIVLNLEQDEAAYVKDVLKLSKNEINSITRFETGEALIISNASKVPVRIVASETEKRMITTDRAELEAIQREKIAAAKAKKAQDIFG